MATARTRKMKAAGAAAAVGVTALAMLVAGVQPAGAIVNSVSGDAFGALVRVDSLTPLAGPTAQVSGSATSPATGYGPFSGTAVPVVVPGILNVGAANARTEGGNLGTPSGFATSSASVANVVVGVSAITATAVSSTCTSSSNGSTGSTQLLTATAGGSPLLVTPLANTPISVPGVLTATLNEQIRTDSPGNTSIVVNAIHIQLLPSLVGAPVVDIVLGHSACAASGPDVNEVTTTTTGGGTTTTRGGGGTTTTTPGGGGTTTTSGGGGTTTTSGGGGTTTTPGGGGTTTTNFSGVTTVPGGGTPGGGSVVAGVLARTGAFLSNAFVWAALVVFLGGLALLGSKGEVQTWPPRRSSRRSYGPKRSGSSWPRKKGRPLF